MAAGNEQSGRLALVGLRRVCGVRILLRLKGIGFSISTDPDAILLAGNAAVALSLGTGCTLLRIVVRQ
jgi:hypothetical protein